MLQAFSDLHTTTGHCDLKPANIMVDIEGNNFLQIKIVDWASSCSVTGGECCKANILVHDRSASALALDDSASERAGFPTIPNHFHRWTLSGEQDCCRIYGATVDLHFA